MANLVVLSYSLKLPGPEYMSNKIMVTKTFMPPKAEYFSFLENIFDTGGHVTNQGPLVGQLEEKLKSYLQVENLHYVTNGTVAIQLALSALGLNGGEIITTPFSYVATSSAILWQGCRPVFVDISPNNFTINADLIEEKITQKTRAIVAVHVFGRACEVEKIQEIASRHNLKVIYDAAHAFGSMYKGRSLVSYGDISTCSFHATKLFHTIEGGACIVKDSEVSRKIKLQAIFGHSGDEHYCLGINAKQSEFHAAMGLANLKYIDDLIEKRKYISDCYHSQLDRVITLPENPAGLDYNYAYLPVLFQDEMELLNVFEALNKEDIFPRRYFYPSLNTLPYVESASCPISENISSKIACLPLYADLQEADVSKICKIIKEQIQK